ncbi:MAG TPA: DUF1513 domain-containing protein [Hyphomicrobiaceae bacterium]|nr:DUF1513 domain-containing protein [Hyphomicrobiaceae bacterium]
MEIDRRSLLLGSCATALAGRCSALANNAQALYAAARRGPEGGYSAAIFTTDGRDVRAVALPGRGHDLTVCPVTGRCVVFARRPGNFAIAFSTDRSAEPIAFTTPPDRHFYGHGVFSHDGRFLYATENDFDAGRGVIGIYNAKESFRRIGEFPSYGVGPHDLALLRHAPVLVIANGGLREHPDFGEGRRVLNPDAIETSLAYVDLRNGDLVERHEFNPTRGLSLRHMDVAADGTVVIGAQVQGPVSERNNLVFRHRRQQEPTALELPEQTGRRLAGYISSVAVDCSGTIAAVTSAPGASAVMIEIASGRVLRTVALGDVAGVAPSPRHGEFLLTSGEGELGQASASGGIFGEPAASPWAWDNHAIALPGR